MRNTAKMAINTMPITQLGIEKTGVRNVKMRSNHAPCFLESSSDRGMPSRKINRLAETASRMVFGSVSNTISFWLMVSGLYEKPFPELVAILSSAPQSNLRAFRVQRMFR